MVNVDKIMVYGFNDCVPNNYRYYKQCVIGLSRLGNDFLIRRKDRVSQQQCVTTWSVVNT